MKPLKPNELRVKNIVQDGNGFEMRVVAIHDDGTVYCDFDGNEGDVWEFDDKNPCYGVELTEEILLEWGFEKTDDYGDQIYYEPKDRGNSNYYVCFDHDAISFGLVVFGNCTNLLYDDANLQFVHQFQNLYYALTGVELSAS